MARRHDCPRCGSDDVYLAKRKALFEKLILHKLNIHAYRCHSCSYRYHGFKAAKQTASQELFSPSGSAELRRV